MVDNTFLSAAVDFASILSNDDDEGQNDTDISNVTIVGDDFDYFNNFDFNGTRHNSTTFGFLDNLVSKTLIEKG